MVVGIASTEIIGPEFTPQEPPEMPETNDPFVFNEDGSVDLDLSGKLDVTKRAKFDDDVTIDGILTVQGVDILQEIENLNAAIGGLQGEIAAILTSLQS
jgi:hypothetical protein